MAGVGHGGSVWMRELMLGELPIEEVVQAVRELHHLPYWNS